MSSVMDEVDGRRLHNEIEHSIKSINRELIGQATGDINRDAFENCARMVACLRARYLHTVLALGADCHSECINTDAALELKALREAYFEALEGFGALEHALQRGYIALKS